jgi:hypothetical protein
MNALDSSVTLDEVFAVVVAKRVPLAPELAGYLVLEIAEHADPDGGDVDPKSVFVGEEGTVALVKPRRESATGDAETSIRTALARLLDASGSQTPALSAASRRKSGGGLPSLAEELEAALIPVNRAAGRRALARLAREVKRVTLGVGRNAIPSTSDSSVPSRRTSSPAQPAQQAPPAPPLTPPPPPPSVDPARDASPSSAASRGPAASFSLIEEPTTAKGQIPEEVLRKATPEPLDASEMPTTEFEPLTRTPSPSQTDVDDLIAQFAASASSGERQHARELTAMVGLDPTPPPPPPEIVRRIATRDVPVRESDVEALLAIGAAPPPATPATPPPSTVKEGRRTSSVSRAVDAHDERQLPTQPSSLRKMRASTPSQTSAKRSRGSAMVVLLAAVLVGLGALAVWELRSGAIAGPAPSASTPPAPPTSVQACKATLVVDDVPAQAEVLLRFGQAPIDVPDMPVGARLEFVATADGYAPKRVVVPAGASWDNGSDGKPRYETGVQLDKSKGHTGANDPWPPAEPGSAAGGQGPPGTVHVVATPRGAEVWMLVGLGPEARIEQLHCGQDFDVLVAGPKTFRKRMHVAASDFVEERPEGPKPKVPTRVARLSSK